MALARCILGKFLGVGWQPTPKKFIPNVILETEREEATVEKECEMNIKTWEISFLVDKLLVFAEGPCSMYRVFATDMS
jgi:hypothetical protein